MSSSRKNFTKGYQSVKDDFQYSIHNLFVKQYHGTKCNNRIFINVLFCALCRIQSLFAACRNLAAAPDDNTVAAAILKTLPEYNRLQKLINETLAGQLPKGLFKNPKRLAIDLVLIPYHGRHCYNINEIYRSQSKSGTSHFHAYTVGTCRPGVWCFRTEVDIRLYIATVIFRINNITVILFVRQLWTVSEATVRWFVATSGSSNRLDGRSPLGYEVFAGNTHDSKSYKNIIRTMEAKYGKADRIWCSNRDMTSKENIEFLKQDGRRFITGTAKSELKNFERELIAEDWKVVREGLEVKLCPRDGNMYVLGFRSKKTYPSNSGCRVQSVKCRVPYWMIWPNRYSTLITLH